MSPKGIYTPNCCFKPALEGLVIMTWIMSTLALPSWQAGSLGGSKPTKGQDGRRGSSHLECLHSTSSGVWNPASTAYVRLYHLEDRIKRTRPGENGSKRKLTHSGLSPFRDSFDKREKSPNRTGYCLPERVCVQRHWLEKACSANSWTQA